MEEVLFKFPHIKEEIFDLLDAKSLKNCTSVCKTWKNFLEDPNQKFMWIKIIKEYEKNATLNIHLTKYPLKIFISGSNPKWSKLPIQELREFVKRLDSEKDESKFTEMFLEKYAELKGKLAKVLIQK